MELELQTNVTGVEELKELFELANKQALELQETIDLISKATINIDVEVNPQKCD